jgi:predicted ribosomally synthesized peptide with nif11-like leader
MKGIKEFMATVKNDVRLRDEVRKAGSPDGLVQLGRKAGYRFTVQELMAATGAKAGSGELSEKQLQGVAGGAEGDITAKQPAWYAGIVDALCGSGGDGGGTATAGVRA